MNANSAKNLSLNIEQKTRRKLVTEQRKALESMGLALQDQISAINSRRTTDRLRASGFEGNTREVLQAPSLADVTENDRFCLFLAEIEKRRMSLMRVILACEDSLTE